MPQLRLRRPAPAAGPASGQVVAEVAVAGDHRGAPAQHGVAGQQRPVGRQQQADRVGGVPGRGHHPQLAPGRGQHVAGGQAASSPSRMRRVQRPRPARRSARPAAAPAGVVEVPVGEQDARDPLARRSRPARPPGAGAPRRPARGRPRAQTADPGSAITQVLVPSRVIGDGLGASTQRGPRQVPARSIRVPAALVHSGYPTSPGTVQPAAPVRVARRPRVTGRIGPLGAAAPRPPLRQACRPARQRGRSAASGTSRPRRPRAIASAGRAQATSVGLAADVPGPLAGRQRRGEEPGVEAPLTRVSGVIQRAQGRSRSRAAPGRGGRAARPATATGRAARPVRLPVVAAGVGHHRVRPRAGQQHPGLLERLPDRGADQGPGQPGGASSRPAPGGRVRAGPGQLVLGVAGVDRPAGKDVTPRPRTPSSGRRRSR